MIKEYQEVLDRIIGGFRSPLEDKEELFEFLAVIFFKAKEGNLFEKELDEYIRSNPLTEQEIKNILARVLPLFLKHGLERNKK